jgi:integrase
MSRRRCHQEGSLFKRGTRKKVWVARWWEDVIGAGNKIERVRRSEVLGTITEIPTKREAQQLLDELLRRTNSGERKPQTVLTFRTFVQDRWKPDVYPTLKFSSKKFYDNVVETHLMPVFGDTQLRLISKDSVQSFLTAKAQGDSSWKTVKHIRTVFGGILEAAVRDELLASNPVRKTRMPRRAHVEEKAPISPESLRALLERLPEPSRSIASLLAMTGLRIGELLALRWQDIDFDKGSFSVRQTVYEGHFDVPKSKRSKRTLPLGPVCAQILASLRKPGVEPSALVFSTRNGSPLSRRNLLNRQLKPACKSLGLTGANWHWLRHAHATLLDSVGAALGTVQALLGHASPEVTREVYIGSVPENARTAVRDVEKLIGPKWTQVPDWSEMTSTVIN